MPGGHSPPRPGWVFWLTKTEAGAGWVICGAGWNCGAGRVRVEREGWGLGYLTRHRNDGLRNVGAGGNG